MVEQSQRPRQFRRIHVANPEEITGPTHTPGTCRECHANTVPCWMCGDLDGVPKHHPLTDEVRDITHVAVCPEHGPITQSCPARSHQLKARIEPQVIRDSAALVRVAVVALLLGFILGVLSFFTVFGPSLFGRPIGDRAMSAFNSATSSCVCCTRLFTFNPNLVPSVSINGKREPICRDCVEAANLTRVAQGSQPIAVLEGAYEPEACG